MQQESLLSDAAIERPVKPAVARGWRRTCPSCGDGPMLDGFLKVRHSCRVCGEELYHQRADDGPAYVTILVCGHILAPLILLVFEIYRPTPLVLTLGFTIGFVALALYLLPRFKGMFVAYQWAKRMYGFARVSPHGAGANGFRPGAVHE